MPAIFYYYYARGGYSVESDIDIMIMVDLDVYAVKQKGEKLSYMTYVYNLEYGRN